MDAQAFLAAMLLCAFVIDRVIAALVFLAELLSRPKQRVKHERQYVKLLYFVISGALAVVAMELLPHMRLRLAGEGSISDTLTWLVLVAGADRVSAFIGVASEEPSPPAAQPETNADEVEIHVSGTLRVDRDTAGRLASREAQ